MTVYLGKHVDVVGGAAQMHHRCGKGIQHRLSQCMATRLRTAAVQVCAPLAVVDDALEPCAGRQTLLK